MNECESSVKAWLLTMAPLFCDCPSHQGAIQIFPVFHASYPSLMSRFTSILLPCVSSYGAGIWSAPIRPCATPSAVRTLIFIAENAGSPLSGMNRPSQAPATAATLGDEGGGVRIGRIEADIRCFDKRRVEVIEDRRRGLAQQHLYPKLPNR